MKTLSKYLDDAMLITGSDNQTAKRLNMTRSAISKCRKEGSMRTENIVALAELIGENPALIVAACDVAKNPENKEIWAKWGAIASVILAVGLLAAPQEASAITSQVIDLQDYRLCESWANKIIAVLSFPILAIIGY